MTLNGDLEALEKLVEGRSPPSRRTAVASTT